MLYLCSLFFHPAPQKQEEVWSTTNLSQAKHIKCHSFEKGISCFYTAWHGHIPINGVGCHPVYQHPLWISKVVFNNISKYVIISINEIIRIGGRGQYYWVLFSISNLFSLPSQPILHTYPSMTQCLGDWVWPIAVIKDDIQYKSSCHHIWHRRRWSAMYGREAVAHWPQSPGCTQPSSWLPPLLDPKSPASADRRIFPFALHIFLTTQISIDF